MADIKILIVDDGDADYKLTEIAVRNIQSPDTYCVERAPNYDIAVRAILENRHDIYFIDYRLGARDGFDLIHAVQEQGHEGPFILLSGMDQSAIVEKAKDSGLYGYLQKSEISPFVLERTITYAMERKRFEMALIHEKEFTSFIISGIPYLVISVDRDGLIATMNAYAEELTGLLADDCIGQPWKSVLAPEYRDKDVTYVISKDGHITFEADVIDENDHVRHVSWNVLNKKSNRSLAKDLSFVLSGKDMTEQLERDAREMQRQKTEALGHLAGGVAHEINNLLQPILLAADMLKTDDQDDMSKKMLEKISRNTVNASKIVDDILTYARKESSNNESMPVVKTILSMQEFIDDMIPEGVTCDMSDLDESDQSHALINNTDLYRIIQNICMNGAHAMDNDGVVCLSNRVLNIKDEDAVLFDITPKSQYIVIQIADTGCGIEEEFLNKITDPFFTTKQDGGGTGLGLAIVGNIIRNWDGALDIQSTVGKGTTMSIYLPVHK